MYDFEHPFSSSILNPWICWARVRIPSAFVDACAQLLSGTKVPFNAMSNVCNFRGHLIPTQLGRVVENATRPPLFAYRRRSGGDEAALTCLPRSAHFALGRHPRSEKAGGRGGGVHITLVRLRLWMSSAKRIGWKWHHRSRFIVGRRMSSSFGISLQEKPERTLRRCWRGVKESAELQLTTTATKTQFFSRKKSHSK